MTIDELIDETLQKMEAEHDEFIKTHSDRTGWSEDRLKKILYGKGEYLDRKTIELIGDRGPPGESG
ncbi:MAG: hypothetical protein OXG15_06120 [Gammaproteobacteria bacterium]|nr:hypothetical protein [Gammaproteobacteria bacterium]